MQVAVDGPASSGKSTVAKILAEKLDYVYIDSGAMYRAFTLLVIHKGINLNNISEVNILLENFNISFGEGCNQGKTYMNGIDVTEAIRSKEVTALVSEVSAIEQVREKLVDLQRLMACNSSVVMDGRDIGTVVFPQADVKFFLTASSRVRAERRFLENKEKGYSEMSLDDIERDIQRRDIYDSTREISPLQKADDAIVIDTSNLNINQVVEKMEQIIDSKG